MSRSMGNGADSGVSELESRLLKTGAERLALLGKHAERLMQAYTRDDVPLEGLSDGALRKLLAARVLWRPDEQSGVIAVVEPNQCIICRACEATCLSSSIMVED